MLIIFVFNIWNWGHLIDNISPHFIIVFSTHVFHKKKYLKYECNTELGNFLFVILVFLSIVCTMFTCFLLMKKQQRYIFSWMCTKGCWNMGWIKINTQTGADLENDLLYLTYRQKCVYFTKSAYRYISLLDS